MAFSYQRLKEYSSEPQKTNTSLKSIYSEEIINLLHDATTLRNDIAHRGLPSAQSVSEATLKVNFLNKTLQTKLRDFFEQSTLVKPMQSKFDGKRYFYEVEVLKGLGVNPCKTAVIKTLTPMVFGELYLVIGDISIDETPPILKLFPLMVMEETVKDSDIMGFYFYSDSPKEKDKLRFVCPYPNVETYKFFKQELITENIDA